jgi:hypothetical protein
MVGTREQLLVASREASVAFDAPLTDAAKEVPGTARGASPVRDCCCCESGVARRVAFGHRAGGGTWV